MEAIFEGKKRLLPNSSDLCFYNWNTHACTENSTQSFEVSASHSEAPLSVQRAAASSSRMCYGTVHGSLQP